MSRKRERSRLDWDSGRNRDNRTSAPKKAAQVEGSQNPSQQPGEAPQSKHSATPVHSKQVVPTPVPKSSAPTFDSAIASTSAQLIPDTVGLGDFSVKTEIIASAASIPPFGGGSRQIGGPPPASATLLSFYPWAYRFTISPKDSRPAPHSTLRVSFDGYKLGDKIRGDPEGSLRIFQDTNMFTLNSILIEVPASFSEDYPMKFLVDGLNPTKVTGVATVLDKVP